MCTLLQFGVGTNYISIKMNNFVGSSRWIRNIWFELNLWLNWLKLSESSLWLKSGSACYVICHSVSWVFGCRTGRNLVSTFHLFWSVFYAIFFQTVFHVQCNVDYLPSLNLVEKDDYHESGILSLSSWVTRPKFEPWYLYPLWVEHVLFFLWKRLPSEQPRARILLLL